MNDRPERTANAKRLVPIASSQLFGLVCGLAGVRLTTEFVPPHEFGPYTVFLTLAPLGMWVVHAGLIKFVVRHWAGAVDRVAYWRAVTRTFVRKLPWLGGVAALAALSIQPLPWWLAFSLLFSVAACLAWAAVTQAALQAARQHWRDFFVSASGSATRSFIPPLLFAAVGGSTMGLYAGFGIHAAALALAATIALAAPLVRRGAVSALTLPAAYDGALFVGLAICGWVMAGLHRWLMTFFFGPTEGGYFGLAANLAMLIPSILGTIALQLFQPDFFRTPATPAGREALARKVDRVALGHAAASVAGLLTLRAAAPSLVGPLIRESYTPALPMILSAGAAMLALATGWFYHSMLLAANREQACARLDIASAAVIALTSVIAASMGEVWLLRWMLLLPFVAWLFTRTLARHYFFNAASTSTPAPAP